MVYFLTDNEGKKSILEVFKKSFKAVRCWKFTLYQGKETNRSVLHTHVCLALFPGYLAISGTAGERRKDQPVKQPFAKTLLVLKKTKMKEGV